MRNKMDMAKAVAAGALFGIMGASAAFADGTAMRACMMLAGDAARLKCFEALVPAATKDGSDWLLETHADPMTDKPITTVVTTAISGVNALGTRPILGFRCIDGKISGVIIWGAYLTSSVSERSDAIFLNVRLGKGPEINQVWTISNNNTATIYDNGAYLLHEVLQVDRYVVQAQPYHQNRITAIFNVAGLSSEIAAFKKDCGFQG